MRGYQHRGERNLHTLLEAVAVLERVIDEMDQRIDFGISNRAPVGAASKVGEVDTSARQRIRSSRIGASEHAAVALGGRQGSGIVGAADFDGSDARVAERLLAAPA